jgi:hypothetical protein
MTESMTMADRTGLSWSGVRTIGWLAGILVTAGIFLQTIQANAAAIQKNAVAIQANAAAIQEMRIYRAEMENELKNQSDKLCEIRADVKKLLERN